MKDLIRKILKESEDEFEWVKNIPHTNIEVLGDDSTPVGHETFLDYVDGKTPLTSMLNVLYRHGVDNAIQIFDSIGGYIIDELGYDKLGISPQYRNRREENNRWAFTMYFTSLLSGDVLRATFGQPLYHDEFGEGGDDLQDRSYASYMLKINNTIIHVGYDHRGTSVEVPYQITDDELISVLKTLVDETSTHM